MAEKRSGGHPVSWDQVSPLLVWVQLFLLCLNASSTRAAKDLNEINILFYLALTSFLISISDVYYGYFIYILIYYSISDLIICIK